MTEYEILSILVAVVVGLPGLIALIRQSAHRRRLDQLEEAQLRQNRATAALHEKQLELLLASEVEPQAHVKLDLIRDGHNYRFRVTNVGSVPAHGVHFRILGEPMESPLVEQDYNAKFPAPILQPGSKIDTLAAIYLSSPSSFNAIVSWTNPDRSVIEDEAYVSL